MTIFICSCGGIRNSLAKCKSKDVEHVKLGAITINDKEFETRMSHAPNNVAKTPLNAWIKTHKKHLVETTEPETERRGDIRE